MEKLIRELKRKLGLNIQVKYIYCGKPFCKSCPHGPYLYINRRVGKKVKTEYLGKADPYVLERKLSIYKEVFRLLSEYDEKVKALQEEYQEKVINLLAELEENSYLPHQPLGKGQ